eukprot:CAMPEP_0172532680 /NCGR_PEP_ID=MMETSP1067-20121228/5647_1 /TAXON_ID=265564 ORGANISM="Thalassiosira punctigera, Strain Tpunct2005C2" /NCGR_SAMPLE_ID=MMETSP1067 /ASSEMBLY_ACC=CAM_ASM_000444 /LENGTH=380 /DNA_ID=CAMNT_0013317227 /DNA_START=563 /DNA_END=1704 /DNA_ORIENTATION=+
MNYAFADDPPILTRGKNRRAAGGRNFQGRGGSAGQASSPSARARQQPQQTNFSFGDSGAPAGAHRSNRDDASCAGSLEYSASSSVLSSDASGENRFDQILKDFDSELATEIATRAAAERTSRSAAVEGWKQRLESRQQQAGVAATSQQRMQTNRQAQQTQGKRGQPQSQPQQSQFTMATSSQGVPSNPNVTFNYSHSRDNSSEGSDVFGEDFFDESLFDTISRYDNDKEVQETHVPRHVPASSKPKARTPAAGDPFRGQDPFRNTDPFQTSSARGRANMGHVTPPPHTGLKLGAGSNVALCLADRLTPLQKLERCQLGDAGAQQPKHQPGGFPYALGKAPQRKARDHVQDKTEREQGESEGLADKHGGCLLFEAVDGGIS